MEDNWDRFGTLPPSMSENTDVPKMQLGSGRTPFSLDSDLPAQSWLQDEPSMGLGAASSSDRPLFPMECEKSEAFIPPHALNGVAPTTEGLHNGIAPSMITPSEPSSIPFSPPMSSQLPVSTDDTLGFSSVRVIRPPRNQLPPQMKIIVNGLPATGAKSRVETQIRMRLELVAPAASSDPNAPIEWERIGSFDHIKVPPLSGTKRKSKKYQNFSAPPESTLLLEANVINATPPHARVYVCNSCRERERKRADRKKSKNSTASSVPTKEEMHALNIDPNDPNALGLASSRLQEEERKHAVLFNCGDYVSFHDGEVVLSTRITCYCRHHREKIGFHIVYTLRNYRGEFIATGSTPPIMIMDDHKSSSQYANISRMNEGRHKQLGSDDSSMSPHAVDGTLRSRERPKPYDDPSSLRRRTRPLRDVSQSPLGPTRMPYVLDGSQTLPGVDASPTRSGLDTLSPSSMASLPESSSMMPTRNMDQLFMPMSVPTDIPTQATERPQLNGSVTAVPRINKLVPAEGPTTGGIEITVLGENFTEGIQCVFGDTPSTHTRVWASTTLVCILPPSFRPGPVIVSLQGAPDVLSAPQESQPLQLFTYVDSTDRALMELALQVVGMQMTGQMASARDIAMRIVSASQTPEQSTSYQTNVQNTLAPNVTELLSMGLRLYSSKTFKPPSIQDSLLGFLTLLDVDMDTGDYSSRPNALLACNSRGHTLLHLAVMHNFHRLVADLLRRGCPVNTRDTNGYTALHFAALHGCVMVSKLLLEHGADPFEVTDEGLIPVEIARRSEMIDVEHVLTDWVGNASSSDCGDETSDDEDDGDDNQEVCGSSAEEDTATGLDEHPALAQTKDSNKQPLSTPRSSTWSLTNLLSNHLRSESDTKASSPVSSPPPTYDEATLDEAGDLNYIDGEKLLTDSGVASRHQKRKTKTANPLSLHMRRDRRAMRRNKHRAGTERSDAAAKTVVRPRQGLYDDRMLLWFWIPAMLCMVLLSMAIQFGFMPSFQYEGSYVQRAVELLVHT
ncbi:hypothetical protein MNAN1_002558 [Malassezia nana]|uniref:IPT/TIG domain-containing protein n=1 Tax=Malassezia nana TaxID=180528 RepID=A0AAF0EKQ7_9BASI|nr:hypothetical protein MNAN1_002558 [Malassezia nana]